MLNSGLISFTFVTLIFIMAVFTLDGTPPSLAKTVM